MYGDTHKFKLNNAAEGGLELNLTIPFKEMDSPVIVDRSYLDSGPVPAFKTK